LQVFANFKVPKIVARARTCGAAIDREGAASRNFLARNKRQDFTEVQNAEAI
jgi:hypothetical protein